MGDFPGSSLETAASQWSQTVSEVEVTQEQCVSFGDIKNQSNGIQVSVSWGQMHGAGWKTAVVMTTGVQLLLSK